MSAMGSSNTKVLIVGGSITGLTLAHCLSRAGIEHIVLEKRAEIAPQEGAFIGLWPNGAQVLQQLGIYESLETLTTPVDRMHISYPDGFSFSSLLPRRIHKRLNYPIVSLDRKKVLEILYHHYPDKSKIITNKKVLEVQLSGDEAIVVTDDGQCYHGDLIVGADGVHSRIRSEMWRLADSMNPELITPKEKKSLTIEYACVFGISLPIAGLQSGEHINRYGDKFCVITFHGKGDRVFWFIIQKLDRVYSYSNAPRYSPKDAAALCGKLRDVKILGDVSVGDLWKTRQVASMTALEEGIFETWHYNRIVLLGDSTRKMAPNIGQGANTAIEDAAVLASLLNRLIIKGTVHNPSSAAIDEMLREYKTLRFERVKSTCRRAKFGARFHARDDWLKAWSETTFPDLLQRGQMRPNMNHTKKVQNGKGQSSLSNTLAAYGELMRVHRPLGFYLNTSPYIVSVAFAASASPARIPLNLIAHRTALLCVWSFFLRCGGCAWNDLIDSDLDCQVSRTRSRPIPRGAVSKTDAALLTLVLFLTLANIGWAVPMAMHSLGLDTLTQLKPTVCMYMFIATSIIMVDVIYARQDTEDDTKAGIRSMAVRFRNSINFVAYSLLYTSTAFLAAAGAFTGLGLPFFIVSVGGHFIGFLILLQATRVGKSSKVEAHTKSPFFLATVFWVLGFVTENCINS
ncbi:hypothetical protein ZTR_09748 [Talaromyces verruculosus]|nr:hypothetical protein ZTR_09748 [Talaromyces verruculosus]